MILWTFNNKMLDRFRFITKWTSVKIILVQHDSSHSSKFKNVPLLMLLGIFIDAVTYAYIYLI